MSPAALLEIQEEAHALIHMDAVRALVAKIFALDVTSWNDENFAALAGIIDQTIAILSATPIAEHRPFILKLQEAKEGIEQGVAPDPAKRPTVDEMRAFVSAHLSPSN